MTTIALPGVETPLEILTRDTRISTHVVGVDGSKVILIGRTEAPLPDRVMLRWADAATRRPVSVEAVAATVPASGLIALVPVERPQGERRARPRHNVAFTCAVDGKVVGGPSSGKRFAGTIDDVSAGGLSFLTGHEIPPGTAIEVTVKRPGGGSYLRERPLKVVQCRQVGGRYRIGCDAAIALPNEAGLAALVEDAITGRPL